MVTWWWLHSVQSKSSVGTRLASLPAFCWTCKCVTRLNVRQTSIFMIYLRVTRDVLNQCVSENQCDVKCQDRSFIQHRGQQGTLFTRRDFFLINQCRSNFYNCLDIGSRVTESGSNVCDTRRSWVRRWVTHTPPPASRATRTPAETMTSQWAAGHQGRARENSNKQWSFETIYWLSHLIINPTITFSLTSPPRILPWQHP